MNTRTENLQNLQVPISKILDEMSKQTLDALKVVHSFESKPARSLRVRQIIENNTLSFKPPANPVRATSSPERVVRSPRSARSSDKSQSPVPAKVGRKLNAPNQTQPVKENTANEQYLQTAFTSKRADNGRSLLTAALPKHNGNPRNDDTSLIKPSIPKPSYRSAPKTNISTTSNVAVSALRSKASSTASNTSRLLQPTAASVAKVNNRILPRPASKGAIHSHSGNHTASHSHTTSILPMKPMGNRILPLNEPAKSSFVATFPPVKPQPTANQSVKPQAAPASTRNLFATTQIPNLSTHPSFVPEVMISTPVSKNPAFKAAQHSATKGESTTVNPSMLTISHENPAKTSTPVRPLVPVPTAENDSTMPSIDCSNFTNFSYIADWAQTPELAKKAMEQRHVDTLRLFGNIPPVDIEAIFGSEIRRQQRQ